MLRMLSVGLAAVTLLGLSSVPALASTSHRPTVHHFGIPGVAGISAWGSYYKTSKSVRVTLCVKDTSAKAVIAVAGGAAVSKDGNRVTSFDIASTEFGVTDCSTTITSDTGALVVMSLSGDKNGNLHASKPKVLYGNATIISVGGGGPLVRLGAQLRMTALTR